ncbi:DivIVA domain-containing protein [Actinoplanes sp. L3-i22]|uniref:DivIVA domain-containing protein n=1 Tax=Actinoplanes sp. L3-i22 TaxID=2836373 RepID=UPI0021056D20|nr:DivIVA domain-containing protein [Actinoplanes sp. L3-i22]
MSQLLLFIVVALVVGTIVFGVTVLLSGGDSGLTPVEPDGQSVPLPGDRPLGEEDIAKTRFDTAWRGYRMAQVDQALQRAAYDIGYKGELIGVLEAEVAALREGRTEDADALRAAREAAIAPSQAAAESEKAESEKAENLKADREKAENENAGPVVEVAEIPPPATDEEPAETR